MALHKDFPKDKFQILDPVINYDDYNGNGFPSTREWQRELNLNHHRQDHGTAFGALEHKLADVVSNFVFNIVVVN